MHASDAGASENNDGGGSGGGSGGSGRDVGLSTFLALVMAAVVVGNGLVIVAVLMYAKLRQSVSNAFVASLAAADFLLGVTVLPFAAHLEISEGLWAFERDFCTVWLALDVWMCTASIYHLCAISFDRYLAVSFPLRYRRLMSGARCRLLIIGAWTASFLVCFPPLVGWHWQDSPLPALPTALPVVAVAAYSADVTNVTMHGGAGSEGGATEGGGGGAAEEGTGAGGGRGPFANRSVTAASMSQTCDVIGASTPGYVVFSALGSFYIPSTIMLFFYAKVFIAARKCSQAVNVGVIRTSRSAATSVAGSAATAAATSTSSDASAISNKSRGISVTLRVHRGRIVLRPLARRSRERGGPSQPLQSQSPNILPQSIGGQQPCSAPFSGFGAWAQRHSRGRGAPRVGAARTKSFNLSSRVASAAGRGSLAPTVSPSARAKAQTLPAKRTFAWAPVAARRSPAAASFYFSRRNAIPSAAAAAIMSRLDAEHRGRTAAAAASELAAAKGTRSAAASAGGCRGRVGCARSRLAARHVVREAKAARTLAVVVGAFVVCWLPFFILYVVAGLCPDGTCVPDDVFRVFIWVGYCNSAVNPVVYAVLSKDYRHAFKKLLRCQVSARKERTNGVLSFLASLYIQGSSSGCDADAGLCTDESDDSGSARHSAPAATRDGGGNTGCRAPRPAAAAATARGLVRQAVVDRSPSAVDV